MSHREPFYLLDELSAARHSLHSIAPLARRDSPALINGAGEVGLKSESTGESSQVALDEPLV